MLLLAPAIGMYFGGVVFAVMCAAGAGLAALRVRPAGLWWVLPLAPVAMTPIGHYAYKITWSDGHDTGIFTLENLRELCQCPECRS